MCVYMCMYVCVQNCNCLCSVGVISILLQIKNKSRNRLDVDPNMRCALSVTQPQIRQLTEKKHISLPTDV